jgi:hypothetical protein
LEGNDQNLRHDFKISNEFNKVAKLTDALPGRIFIQPDSIIPFKISVEKCGGNMAKVFSVVGKPQTALPTN